MLVLMVLMGDGDAGDELMRKVFDLSAVHGFEE